MMKLHTLAHARSGDKGDVCNIAVIAHDASSYPAIAGYLTAERVRQHFGPMISGPVERHSLPHLGALNFVLHGALAGGVNRSLALDTHGKCFAALLLDIELPRGDAAVISSS
jgi:hypothetical protein